MKRQIAIAMFAVAVSAAQAVETAQNLITVSTSAQLQSAVEVEGAYIRLLNDITLSSMIDNTSLYIGVLCGCAVAFAVAVYALHKAAVPLAALRDKH